MTISDLRALVSRGYGNSVLRRSFLLLCLMGPAFALNLLLYYVATALLSPESFGLFYVAVTIANVLYSGSFVLNIFFTRYLVTVVDAAGEVAAYETQRRIQMLVARWGALGALVCVLVLIGLGKWIGVQSWAIVIFVVLDAYSAYLVDINRAFLQSLRKTLPLGIISLAWMALRFVLGAGGMVLFGNASGGLLGVVLAAVTIIAGYSLLFFPQKETAVRRFPALPPVRALVPVILGYASLIGVSNLDVLLTYLLLRGEPLGAYSASSVFPKGILVVVTPLLQTIYPMMVGDKTAPPNIRIVLKKSAGIVLLLSSAMALGFFLFSGWLCGGPWGLKLCRPMPLHLLLISAIMLSVLRALVLYQSARGRDWVALTMIVPSAVYLWIAAISERTVENIALQFMGFSAVLLVYYGGIALLLEQR